MSDTTDQIEIKKAEASTSVESTRIRTGEIGTPNLRAVGSWIQNEMRKELTAPYNLVTYEKMRQDATVGAALGTAEAFLTKALANAKFITNSKNTEAKEFCDYLNWNLKNLKDVTWYESCINILTYLQYGFSWLEKVYEPNFSKKHSKYVWKLKKLAPRSQHSIEQWKFDDDGRTVIGLRQYPPQGLNLGATKTYNYNSDPNSYMKRNKFMLFSWDSKNSSPIGVSPLNACYKAWKEKVLIEAMEVSGASKGLNGLVVLRVPTEHINKAAEDPESNEYKTLMALQQQAALMHNGDQTFIMLGSDVQGESGTGKYTYDFELAGVTGTATNVVSTDTIINERKKAILDVFGAGFINLGNEANGSYSLADAKTSLHAFFMEKHMLFIQSVIQNDLVKQLMEINRISLQEDDIPQFQLDALDQINPDEYGKLGQRLGAVGLIPLQKEFLIDFWKKCGLNTDSLADLSEDALLQMLTAHTSRAGDGMKEGMGSGTGSSLGNNSAVNSDNAA
jgi:hypothetical protein